jgi:hypothetical protein
MCYRCHHVILWNGKHNFDAPIRLQCALRALKSADIDKNIIIQLSDSGAKFDEIANYLDRNYELAYRKS